MTEKIHQNSKKHLGVNTHTVRIQTPARRVISRPLRDTACQPTILYTPTANVIQLRLDAIHNTYTHAHTHTSKIHTHSQHELYCALQRHLYLELQEGITGDSFISSHRDLALTWNNGSLAHLIGIVQKLSFWHCFFQPQVNHENFQKWKTNEFFWKPFQDFLNSVNPIMFSNCSAWATVCDLINEWQNIFTMIKQLCKNSHYS